MTEKKSPIYLDYNATAPLLPKVRDGMIAALELIGNPSSVHTHGRNARKAVETARQQIAQLVACDPTHVTFTSGATEANQTVLLGAPAERLLISSVEHPSVMENVKGKKNVTLIPVDKNGVVDLTALEKELARDESSALVSIMWVNNETGVIQPIKDIAVLCKKYHALFHCDAVQAAGRVTINLEKISIDYLTLSAHKIGGPAGVGALIYNHETSLSPMLRGGGQERRRRAGTENTIGIIGFGIAAHEAAHNSAFYATLAQWRDGLEKRMSQAIPTAIFAGQGAPRVANTIQVILPGLPSETQLMALDLAGVSVSSGSACSSGSVKPSHVLLAMGVSEGDAKCALRVSMGVGTTEKQLDFFFHQWVANWQRSQTA